MEVNLEIIVITIGVAFGILFSFFQVIFLFVLNGIRSDIKGVALGLTRHLEDHAQGNFEKG